MCLILTFRYLYVNVRAWPPGCTIRNPMHPPPMAQEIDIHVIDLVTLQQVGSLLRAHRAYTPNDECFFIFLDVSSQYVARCSLISSHENSFPRKSINRFHETDH